MRVSLASRILRSVAFVPIVIALVGAPTALASKPDPFCPRAFDSGTVDTLAGYLAAFYTYDQIKAFDKNDNNELCWLHIVGVGWQIMDDATPR